MAFKDLFKKKQPSIADLSIDELRLAKIRLERDQEQLMRRVNDLEKEKNKLFQQAVTQTSERSEQLLRQKIMELEFQAKYSDKQLASYAKQLRALERIIGLKLNDQHWNRESSSMVDQLARPEVQEYVDSASARQMLDEGKLDDILNIVLADSGLDDDEDELSEAERDLKEQIQRARAAGQVDTGLDQLGRAFDGENPEK